MRNIDEGRESKGGRAIDDGKVRHRGDQRAIDSCYYGDSEKWS